MIEQPQDALLGSVTHNLRTPLAAIQVAGESLLEPHIAWSEEERHEFAETIVSSADRLRRSGSTRHSAPRAGQVLSQTASARNTTTYRTFLETFDHAYRQGDR